MFKLSSTNFQFATDEESLAYLQEIVGSMVQLFSVKPEHCIDCINQAWSQMPMVGDDLVYRESPTYWANHFILGKDSYWWVQNREHLEPLKHYLTGLTRLVMTKSKARAVELVMIQ